MDRVSSPRRERTRLRILDAANQLLLERGYHGVGLETVATQAGVSRQTVYDQFGSKSGLLGAMVSRQEQQAGLQRVLQTVVAQVDGLSMLSAMLDAIVTVEPLVYPYSRLVYAARLEDAVASEMWQARMASRRAGMAMVCARLASDGRLLPGLAPEEAAEIAWAIASPHQYEYLVIERGWDIDRYRDHLERTIVARLLRPPAIATEVDDGRPGRATGRPPRKRS